MYEPKGEYQLVCEHLQPRGLGALQLAFEQLKAKLQAEGLFAPARKRPLPSLPAKIGIVTSLDGAALRDIIKVLNRRHPTAHLVIRPARVQGEGAAAEVAAAIRAIGRVPGVGVVIKRNPGAGGSGRIRPGGNEEDGGGAEPNFCSNPIPAIGVVVMRQPGSSSARTGLGVATVGEGGGGEPVCSSNPIPGFWIIVKSNPPKSTARRWPSTRSASHPPGRLARYTIEV